MSRQVRVLPKVRQDLAEHYAFIAGDSLSAAERFLAMAEQIFHQLGEVPHLGRTLDHADPRLAGLRLIPIGSFRNYLVFYRLIGSDVEIVRVLHGSRDIDAVLTEEA